MRIFLKKPERSGVIAIFEGRHAESHNSLTLRKAVIGGGGCNYRRSDGVSVILPSKLLPAFTKFSANRLLDCRFEQFTPYKFNKSTA